MQNVQRPSFQTCLALILNTKNTGIFGLSAPLSIGLINTQTTQSIANESNLSMIFGAEGLIGIVNIGLGLGILALIILTISGVRYARSADYKQQVKLHTVRYCVMGLVLSLLALPTAAFSLWAGWDYLAQKPYRDTFELNNKRASELYNAMQEDNLERFKQALTECGDYCLHADPGEKKYDELLISAGYAKASKITAYLNTLNLNEIATPQALSNPSQPILWMEIETNKD